MTTIESLALSGKSALWLDFYRYAAALLARGAIPWLNQADFAAFHGKAQGLLKSDVVTLPVECVAAALLNARPALRSEMSAKSRATFPLRSLLAQDSLRTAVNDLLEVLRLANSERPLALMLPSPRRWLASTFSDAFGQAPYSAQVHHEEDIGTASMYMADFLRAFADSRLDVIVLEETVGEGPATEQELGWYAPLVNKAQHYRWELGLFDRSPMAAELPAGGGVDFHIRPELPHGMVGARILPESYWSGSSSPPALDAQQIWYAHIPADGVPEAVLRQLAALRARTVLTAVL